MRDQGKVPGATSQDIDPTLLAIEDLPNILAAIIQEHRPSRMPFFQNLASLPRELVCDATFLGQIHLLYQSAMHATRAAVYHLPHLDRPALRKRKLQILIDDDGLPNGDTHHYQLTRAFLSIGAICLLDEEEFGESGELCHYLEGETAHFVRLVQKLYSRSLGPWCAIEMMSIDWMRALAESLSFHFPHFKHEQYFADCFSQYVEERHAAEALEITQMVLRTRPELLHETLRDAKMMAEALDGVWMHLDRIVRNADAKGSPRSGSIGEHNRAARVPARPPREDVFSSPAGTIRYSRVC